MGYLIILLLFWLHNYISGFVMSDSLTKEQRHFCMSKIKNKNTRPELLVRHYLHANGLRYRIAVRALPGTPDIVLPKYRTIVFVNGCFWHGHDCSAAKLPLTNRKFWEDKIAANKQRDATVLKTLKLLGWQVLIVWQCRLKSSNRDGTLKALLNDIKQNYNNEKVR